MSAGSDLAAKGGQSGADAYAQSQALASAAKPRQRGGTGAAQGFDAKHPRTAKGRTGGGQFAVKAKAAKQSGGKVVKEPRTPAEIAAFQKSRGLPVTGKMDGRTRTAIRNAQEAARQDAAKEKAKGAGSTRGSSRATSVKLKPGEYAKAGMGSPEKPDARVTNVQRTLDRLGYDVGINGVFGSELTKAVRMFQQNHRLPVTGVVDERTKKWLEVKLAKLDAGKASDHAGLTADTPGTKRNRRTGNVKPVSKKGATGRVAVAREKREREERDRERERRKRRPGGGQQAAGKASDQTRVVMEAEFELLHPRDRHGRWRKKLGLKRLELKGDTRLTKPQVRSRAQKVADAFIDFYGGDKVEALYEPEYLAAVGSDARFRHVGEPMAGLMYGANAHEKMTDPDYGVEWFRVIAHEAAHSISAVTPGPLPGFSQTVEEGAAEILSLWFWKHRGQEFDKRDAAHVDGAWTAAGVESLAHHVAYREWTAEVMRRAAGKVGWDRAAIIDQVEEMMRSGHYERMRFRDEQPMAPPPEGVGEDAVSLVRWLLSDDAVTEAEFREGLHPRGRDGKFIGKMWHGTTSRRGLGKIRPGFFATSSEQEAKDYASIDDYFDPEDQGKLHPVTITLKNPKHFYGSYPGHESPELRGLEEKGHDGVVVHFPPVTSDPGAAMDERTWAYAFQPDAVKIGHDDEPERVSDTPIPSRLSGGGESEMETHARELFWRLAAMTHEEREAFADTQGGVVAPVQDDEQAARDVMRGKKPAVLSLGSRKTWQKVMKAAWDEVGATYQGEPVPERIADVYSTGHARDHGFSYTEDVEMSAMTFGKPDAVDLIEQGQYLPPDNAWRHVMVGVGLGYSDGDIARFVNRKMTGDFGKALAIAREERESRAASPNPHARTGWPFDQPEAASLTQAEEGLVEYLETLRSLQGERYKGEYKGYEDFVLRHGKLFKHGPSESAVEYEFHATTEKQCFRNALTAALNHPELTYVEGWAFTGVLPVHHAWLVDSEGRVHDPTWDGRDLSGERVYLGVPFETDYLAKTVFRKKTDTLFDRLGGGVPLDKAPVKGMLADVPGRPIWGELREAKTEESEGDAQPDRVVGDDDEEIVGPDVLDAPWLDPRVVEAEFRDPLHPRDRLGRFRDVLRSVAAPPSRRAVSSAPMGARRRRDEVPPAPALEAIEAAMGASQGEGFPSIMEDDDPMLDGVRRAARVLAEAHKWPPLNPNFEIQTATLGSEVELGEFRRRTWREKVASYHYEDRARWLVSLDNRGVTNGLGATVFVHEMGHVFDAALAAEAIGDFNSGNGVPLASQMGMKGDKRLTPGQITAWREFLGTALHPSVMRSPLKPEYMRSPHEMWARAYAQWIATTDPEMEAEWKKSPIHRWATDEWEPVGRAVENVLRAHGLLHTEDRFRWKADEGVEPPTMPYDARRDILTTLSLLPHVRQSPSQFMEAAGFTRVASSRLGRLAKERDVSVWEKEIAGDGQQGVLRARWHVGDPAITTQFSWHMDETLGPPPPPPAPGSSLPDTASTAMPSTVKAAMTWIQQRSRDDPSQTSDMLLQAGLTVRRNLAGGQVEYELEIPEGTILARHDRDGSGLLVKWLPLHPVSPPPPKRPKVGGAGPAKYPLPGPTRKRMMTVQAEIKAAPERAAELLRKAGFKQTPAPPGDDGVYYTNDFKRGALMARHKRDGTDIQFRWVGLPVDRSQEA